MARLSEFLALLYAPLGAYGVLVEGVPRFESRADGFAALVA